MAEELDTQEISVTFCISQRDQFQFVVGSWVRNFPRAQLRMFVAIPLVFGFAAFIAENTIQSSIRPIIVVLALYSVLSVGLLLFSLISGWRQLRKMSSDRHSVRYVFDAEKINGTNLGTGVSVIIPWAAMTRVGDTGHALAFYLNPLSVYWVPKHAFVPNEIDTILNWYSTSRSKQAS